jgi:hypothetical protein
LERLSQKAVSYSSASMTKKGESVRRAETPKALRHAAHQKARIQPGFFQNPCQQRGRRGLAVGSRHAEHPAAAQDILGQPLRTGNIGQIALENGFQQRITA